MKRYQLRLYITGETPHSLRAIANLNSLCREHGREERFDISIIDILKDPQLAENEKIIATPTLVKSLPPPIRKVIGDLSNTEKVLLGLDLLPLNASDTTGDKS